MQLVNADKATRYTMVPIPWVTGPTNTRLIETETRFQVHREVILNIPDDREVWIGLVEFQGISGMSAEILPDEAIGGCCQAFAFVANEHDFEHELRAHLLTKYNVSLLTVEDAEPFRHRAARFDLKEELRRIAREVADDGVPRIDVNVYTYHKEDESAK